MLSTILVIVLILMLLGAAYVALQCRMGRRPRWHRWPDIGCRHHPGAAGANIVRRTELGLSASRNWPGQPDRKLASSRPEVHGRDPRANCYSSARVCHVIEVSLIQVHLLRPHLRAFGSERSAIALSHAIAITLLGEIRSRKLGRSHSCGSAREKRGQMSLGGRGTHPTP